MQQPSSLLSLESRIDALIGRVEQLSRDKANLKFELESTVRECKELRREGRRMAARNAKAKSMLEALLSQLPQG